MNQNKITVVIMTYNHKDYIEQAVKSVLAQKTTVNFNIFIHDDCSNDGTSEIIEKLKENYPEKISILKQESRKFLVDGFNQMLFKYVIPFINSDFVAYCDGDDYWIDEYKLQKQYDFMISHPEYSLCFHSAYQLRNNNDISSKWFLGKDGDLNLSDIIYGGPGVPIATSSLFIKADVYKEFPLWRQKFPVEDVPMFIIAAIRGKIHRMKNIMCVYRQFSAGSWSAQNNESNKIIQHLKEMKEAYLFFNKETIGQYDNLVNNQLKFYDFRIALLKKEFAVVFLKANRKFFKKLKFKERISLVLQYKHPKLYKAIR